jgi:hypothetical protein
MPAIPPLLIEVVPLVDVLLVLEVGVDAESPLPELLVVDDFVIEAEAEDEDEVEVVDDVDVVYVVETPIVAAIATRLFIAQQASDVRSPPQHQLPSVKH